ncbi:hypothetical protein ACFFRR_004734 [Megaselia abdita]
MSTLIVVIFAVLVASISCTQTKEADKCGYRNPYGIGSLIISTNEANYGEFPWTIAVLEKGLPYIRCGGSLIHPQVVLTAAHCFQDIEAKDIKVRAVEWNNLSLSELYPNKDRAVQEIVVHKDFNKNTLINDVAILFLKQPYQLEEKIRPICLPPANSNFDFARCYVTGWDGDYVDRQGKYQGVLKKVNLPTIPRNTCQNTLRTQYLVKDSELHPSLMCAGGEAGKCKGEGGSAMVCPIEGSKDRYYQVGIVAFGMGCRDAHPGFYANILFLRPWIDEQLQHHGVDSSYYTA